jgi:hypothetical protein
MKKGNGNYRAFIMARHRCCGFVAMFAFICLGGCAETEHHVNKIHIRATGSPMRVYDTEGRVVASLPIASGEQVILKDDYLVTTFVTFFPGVTSLNQQGGMAYWVRSPKVLEASFSLDDRVVDIYIKPGYWGFADESGGDRPIKGNFEAFIMALLYRPEVQAAPKTSEGN